MCTSVKKVINNQTGWTTDKLHANSDEFVIDVKVWSTFNDA
jgi:hypothetical protein